MATIKIDYDQVSDIVVQELRFHIESSIGPTSLYEPELVQAMWEVLEFYSVPSEFDQYKESLKWKLQMENQV